MSIEYVSLEEIETHEVAMQRLVEEKGTKLEAISKEKKAAIKASQRAFDEAVKTAEEKADQEVVATEAASESHLAAMQRDFERLPLLLQVYHEAPDDVFELIVSKCKDLDELGWGRGGLDAFRLANKRCKQVVESCTTKLTNRQEEDGPDSLPIPIIQRCRRIEEISCRSHNLRCLEGCPDGLKKLWIGNAPHLSDLSPLASCSLMKLLWISDSSITDISVVSSMPLLWKFGCQKNPGRPSIKDLSPLSSCTRLKKVHLYGNRELRDLSPLSACTTLEDLKISSWSFRLVNKRCKQVVESCTTRLTNLQEGDGPDSLPIPIIQRCERIVKIRCASHNLRSLEGCPDGLKKLSIGFAPHLSDLSPLNSCSMMDFLWIDDSSITDISVVSSMPLLERFGCQKVYGSPSIKDLSPLSSCTMMKRAYLNGNHDLKDFSPLSACTALEDLVISSCPLITSLAPLSSITSLKTLACTSCPLITSLSPLSNLKNLRVVRCRGIGRQASVLPLSSSTGLKELRCHIKAVDLEELKRRLPDLKVNPT